jgi:hypothetical protein
MKSKFRRNFIIILSNKFYVLIFQNIDFSFDFACLLSKNLKFRQNSILISLKFPCRNRNFNFSSYVKIGISISVLMSNSEFRFWFQFRHRNFDSDFNFGIGVSTSQGCGSGSGLDPDSVTLWIRIQ